MNPDVSKCPFCLKELTEIKWGSNDRMEMPRMFVGGRQGHL